MIRSVFLNQNGQLRAGWRIGLIMALGLLVSAILQLTVLPGLLFRLSRYSLHLVYMVIAATGQLVLVASTLLVLKAVDKRTLEDIGVARETAGLGYGLTLGALSMTAVFAVLVLTGGVAVVTPWYRPVLSGYLFLGLILFILVGWAEELFFRGYSVTALNRSWAAAVMSAIIFSMAHGLNANITALALANIFLAGLLFAYMMLRTGSIWMPVGYHITWNYFQGPVLGLPVSGGGIAPGMYEVMLVEDNLLTGGAFGPEGGLAVTAVLLLGFLAVRWHLGRTRH